MISTSLLNKSLVCLNLLMTLLTSQTLCFMSAWFQSKTHQDISRDAILLTVADVCRSQASQRGRNFIPPQPLTVNSVAKACSSSAKELQSSINEINHHNAWVDFWHFFSARYHFDNEEFLSGRQIITEGVFTVKHSIKQKNYHAARETLGKVLHTLQDFYSHSNWIELGKTQPYSNLIKPDTPISNIADSETCRSCYSDVCGGDILEEIIAKRKLTSGYVDWSKPKGKCSHGGLLKWDQSGINKDSVTSSHGYLHYTAASVATKASRELLQDIRAAVGDSEFLRLMGLIRSSVLCFVIDTTDTMFYEVRRVTSSIIDSKAGTGLQSSEYILVPFNDINYGPLTRTTDPKVFKQKLNALTADGGGDSPKMSLSALQLALTGSPPQTDIFVFTNADAKDKALTKAVQTLIERTKSKVTFMLSTSQHWRHGGGAVAGQHYNSTLLLTPLYHKLAQVSGGQAIEVTKRTLARVTDIISVSTGSKLVTLFQAARKPGKAENFSVFVDSSVQNLTIYITGNSPVFSITSPSGVSQKSNELRGILGFIQKFGNLHTVKPNIAEQSGLWIFRISSTQHYTIRVVGQSEVDFLLDFVVKQKNPGYAVLNSRPATNSNVTLLMTTVGSNVAKPTEVSLVPSSSFKSLYGSVEDVANGQYLVTFNSIPAGEFTVHVVGELSSNRSLGSILQRQTPTQFRTSNVTITTQPVGTMQPGTPFTLPYTVSTRGSGGRFNIRVSTSRSYVTLYKTSINLVIGRSADDVVTLFAPESTSSGTDVTVTIQAEAADGSDYNYIALRLVVIAPVTDFTPPLCEVVRLNANCSGNCSSSAWYLTANVTDGSGSGVQSVRVLNGNGNLSTRTVLNETGVNITMVVYSSSCCTSDLELIAVDVVGNVATCFKFVRDATLSSSTGSPGTATNTTMITITTESKTAATDTTGHPIRQTYADQPILSTNTASTVHPTTKTNTTSTVHPTNKSKRTSTVHPTTKSKTASTDNSTTKTNTTSTKNPTTKTNTTSLNNTTTKNNTTSTVHPTTKTKTTSTDNPTTKNNTTSTDNPTTNSNTTSTVHPTTKTNTTSTDNPTTKTNTTYAVHPTTKTKTPSTFHPTTKTNTTYLNNTTTKTNTTYTVHPTTKTNTTSTDNPTTNTNTTSTVNPTIKTNTTSTDNSTTKTNTTSTVHPTTMTNTTSRDNTTTKTNTTSTAHTTTKTNTTSTYNPPTKTNTSTDNPTTKTNTISIAHPTTKTNTTSTYNPPTKTNTSTDNPTTKTKTTSTDNPTTKTNTSTDNPTTKTNTTLNNTTTKTNTTNTTSTYNPPTKTNTSTDNPTTKTKTTSTDNPTTKSHTTSTAHPTTKSKTASTAHPTTKTKTASTDHPTTKSKTASTDHPTTKSKKTSTVHLTTKTNTTLNNTTTKTNTTNTTSTYNPPTKTNTSTDNPTTKTKTTSTDNPTIKTNTTSTAHPSEQTSTDGAECCMFLPFLWFNIGISLYQFLHV